jgi:hypothetical protein
VATNYHHLDTSIMNTFALVVERKHLLFYEAQNECAQSWTKDMLEMNHSNTFSTNSKYFRQLYALQAVHIVVST